MLARLGRVLSLRRRIPVVAVALCMMVMFSTYTLVAWRGPGMGALGEGADYELLREQRHLAGVKVHPPQRATLEEPDAGVPLGLRRKSVEDIDRFLQEEDEELAAPMGVNHPGRRDAADIRAPLYSNAAAGAAEQLAQAALDAEADAEEALVEEQVRRLEERNKHEQLAAAAAAPLQQGVMQVYTYEALEAFLGNTGEHVHQHPKWLEDLLKLQNGDHSHEHEHEPEHDDYFLLTGAAADDSTEHPYHASHISLQPDLVSVVLPVFNGAQSYLKEAVESIFKHQVDAGPLELIVVDDGSTDQTTVQYLRELEADAELQRLRQSSAGNHAPSPSLKIIRQTNTGLPGALNAGFDAARGTLLTWISADNIQLPLFVATLRRALESHEEADFAYADFINMDANGVDTSRQVVGTLTMSYAQIISRNYGMASFMYRRRCADAVGKYDTSLMGTEDWDYWLRVRHNCGPWVYAPVPLVRYRRHPLSMSATIKLDPIRHRTRQKAIVNAAVVSDTLAAAWGGPVQATANTPGSAATLEPAAIKAINSGVLSSAALFSSNLAAAAQISDYRAAQDILYFARGVDTTLLALGRRHLERCQSSPQQVLDHSSRNLALLCAINLAVLDVNAGHVEVARTALEQITQEVSRMSPSPYSRQLSRARTVLEAAEAAAARSQSPKAIATSNIPDLVAAEPFLRGDMKETEAMAKDLQQRQTYVCAFGCGLVGPLRWTQELNAGAQLDLSKSSMVDAPIQAPTLPGRLKRQSLAVLALGIPLGEATASINPFGMFRHVFVISTHASSMEGKNVAHWEASSQATSTLDGDCALDVICLGPETVNPSAIASIIEHLKVGVVHVVTRIDYREGDAHHMPARWWEVIAHIREHRPSMRIMTTLLPHGEDALVPNVDAIWAADLAKRQVAVHAEQDDPLSKMSDVERIQAEALLWVDTLKHHVSLVVAHDATTAAALVPLLSAARVYHGWSSVGGGSSARAAATLQEALSPQLPQGILYRTALATESIA
ncbi:glycosyl transferase [Capsaspora owczarzaki ATCC 30864]|uniref:Glycosyl transferase n=1 Tax=Capsaspora owczarzaki (strain ATCC 30864) TaxID=595528 RepID=A0A0D2WNF6_CAPO3|nr:glycosyl transferase [Capsaspora owczarzaki ATCC 30864]KJE92605.1 glycosyl transferase [Capsaspora owczarzaki ATCC 30864]|eukprot:XP_004348436.1 glycosyl transferase [Capsaspora owczarzaki ATCC 30864]